jgi:hypothetical protein
MRMTPENLKGRQQFLTTELFNSLSAAGESDTDYFTATDKYPKAFRVGSCTSDADDKAVLQVVLLWRTDTENDQKEVKVEALKTGDKWLVNKVTK